jgi:hypothetical protein
VLVAGLAATATAEQSVAHGQVPFEFKVGSTTLPAGRYEILVAADDENVLIVRNEDTKKRVLVDAITRLAPRDDGQATLVFDEAGGERVLSEIHLTDSDGYQLAGVGKKPHTHKVVKVS